MSALASTQSRVADPARARATDAVEQELVLLLRQVRARLEHLAREVHPGLDAAAYGILHLVNTGQATTVTELASRLAVGKPTVSRQVTAIEQLGLLRREPARSDRRAVPLQLTPEGVRRLGVARHRREEQFRSLLAEWTVDDVTALGDLLGRLNRLTW